MKSSFSDSGNFETLEIQEIYYAHGRQKLTLLHLFTGLFRKEICPHSSEYLQGNPHLSEYLQGYYLTNILMSEEKFPFETDL